MTITSAVTLNPVYSDSTISARMRLANEPLALLSCRMCGWRVGGRLDNLEQHGAVVRALFVADEPPVIPPRK